MTVIEIAFLVIFWSWVCSAILFLRSTCLPRLPILQNPASCNFPAVTVTFQASDGRFLEGWKVVGTPGRPWIIGCHGLGSNRSDLLDIAGGLQRAGFNLFLFDFRGHGGSSGRVTSFGWQERCDLEGALVYLGRQPDVPPRPYGVYGISMGASVALMVAAWDERIGAVAIDSPYTDLQEVLRRHLALYYARLPRIPFLWFVLATYRLRFGIWPKHVSPEVCAAQLGERPLLLIHGASDLRTPAEAAKRIFDRAGGPKELHLIQGAAHLESFSIEPDVYLARLLHFFALNLT